MSNRCDSCGKLCGLDTEEPEVDASIEPHRETATATVEVKARIVRNSECCGDEVKSADIEVEAEIPADVLKGHMLPPQEYAALIAEKAKFEAEIKILKARVDAIDEKLGEHDLDVDVEADGTERYEGKGRGLRTFFGFSAECEITCSCQKEPIHKVTLSGEVQASEMEDSY